MWKESGAYAGKGAGLKSWFHERFADDDLPLLKTRLRGGQAVYDELTDQAVLFAHVVSSYIYMIMKHC